MGIIFEEDKPCCIIYIYIYNFMLTAKLVEFILGIYCLPQHYSRRRSTMVEEHTKKRRISPRKPPQYLPIQTTETFN